MTETDDFQLSPVRNRVGTFHIPRAQHARMLPALRELNDAAAPMTRFFGDNLITLGKGVGFVKDERFMEAVRLAHPDEMEQSQIWRTHILAWAATHALQFDGDFVEAACYKGYSARVIANLLDFGNLQRRYWLYDLFDHSDDMPHHAMREHSTSLFDQVKARFADLPNVRVTQGALPGSLADACPEKVAFLHLDLNNAAAEIGTMDVLYDRIQPGAAVVLDDYGWGFYREQKIALDEFFSRRGAHVMELPTGQGLVIVPLGPKAMP
jgi:O-methyltransferase